MAGSRLVIVGAGGFGREVLDVLRAVDPFGLRWRFDGFVSDTQPDLGSLERLGATWLGGVGEFLSSGFDTEYVVAIGNPQSRRLIASRFEASGMQAATLVHPSVTMGSEIEIGVGTVVT